MISVKGDLAKWEVAPYKGYSMTENYQGGAVMADDSNRSGPNPVLMILLAAAVVGLAVLGYLYLGEQREQVKIDVPGFEGTFTKGEGADIKIGKD